MWEWQTWRQLLMLYINIVTLRYYHWENRMYSNNFQALNSSDNGYNCIHTYARIVTFSVAAIIYYAIINSAYAFIKTTNTIYHNCVYQGDVYYINQICQRHILITKPLKCLLLYQLKFAIVTNIVSIIYRNINKFLPNTIIYGEKLLLPIITRKDRRNWYYWYCWSYLKKKSKIVTFVHFADAPTYCVAQLRTVSTNELVSTVLNFTKWMATKWTHSYASKIALSQLRNS